MVWDVCAVLKIPSCSASWAMFALSDDLDRPPYEGIGVFAVAFGRRTNGQHPAQTRRADIQVAKEPNFRDLRCHYMHSMIMIFTVTSSSDRVRDLHDHTRTLPFDPSLHPYHPHPPPARVHCSYSMPAAWLRQSQASHWHCRAPAAPLRALLDLRPTTHRRRRPGWYLFASSAPSRQGRFRRPSRRPWEGDRAEDASERQMHKSCMLDPSVRPCTSDKGCWAGLVTRKEWSHMKVTR